MYLNSESNCKLYWIPDYQMDPPAHQYWLHPKSGSQTLWTNSRFIHPLPGTINIQILWKLDSDSRRFGCLVRLPISSWPLTLTWTTGEELAAMTRESERGSCRVPAWTRRSLWSRKGGRVAACRRWERSSSWSMRLWEPVCSTSPPPSIWQVASRLASCFKWWGANNTDPFYDFMQPHFCKWIT